MQPPTCLELLFKGKLATHKGGKAELLQTPLLHAGPKCITVVLTCSCCEIVVFLQKKEGYCFLKVLLNFCFKPLSISWYSIQSSLSTVQNVWLSNLCYSMYSTYVPVLLVPHVEQLIIFCLFNESDEHGRSQFSSLMSFLL